jgi:hypothetical protein
MTDLDARDPLNGELLFEVMQSERSFDPYISLVAKDNKATYDKFLTHVFDFCQELRDHGIPELGWKQFKVAESQDTKISQLCMGQTVQQSKYHIFFTCAKITVTTARALTSCISRSTC